MLGVIIGSFEASSHQLETCRWKEKRLTNCPANLREQAYEPAWTFSGIEELFVYLVKLAGPLGNAIPPWTAREVKRPGGAPQVLKRLAGAVLQVSHACPQRRASI